MTNCCVFESCRGWIALVAGDGNLSASTLPRPTSGEAMAVVEAGLHARRVEDVSAFGNLPDRLRRYFEGERADFSNVSLDLEGYSPFSRAVLLAAQQIPYGEVATYGELAHVVGSPGAARAVGTAMSKNRTPIVVPCHRVIAAGGALGGFSGGLDWKRELLALEGASV
ncbi:MAG: hypothetical protein A2Z18_01800 [Armatimonadetes bacterium RBG_16_58_9]|nr:MAG: hypothetical protein A2Z18_01800 [Armatimonadetes bacterium RBG_16_58_9]